MACPVLVTATLHAVLGGAPFPAWRPLFGMVAPGPADGTGPKVLLSTPTAAAAMAASVPLRNTPLLGLGTPATFGYVTAVAVTFFLPPAQAGRKRLPVT